MNRFAIGSLLGVLLGGAIGCGAQTSNGSETTPHSPTSAAPNGQVCHEERPLGSNISRTVCRSQEDMDRDRESANRYLREPRPVPKTGD
jgi:hypothetical protein